MAEYSISADAAGSAKDNERDRSIGGLFPYTGGAYKTISLLTRRGGVWCNCGGTVQSVTLAVYDQLISGATVIKTSDTAICKCYGTGPSDDNYAETTFSNWTQAESNAAVAAWASDTLVIRRFVSIRAYTSPNHGSPVFRDGYYSDVIAIQGATVPFTQYGPSIARFDVFRSDDGETENPESESVYARIRLSMNDSAGLLAAPRLWVYYAQDTAPGADSPHLDIGAAFGLAAENLNVERTVQLPGTWSNGADCFFLLEFAAGDEAATGKLDMASRAAVPIYIAENNQGVSIGQYSTATEGNPKFECRWPAYLYGGIAQIGDGGASVLTQMGVQWGQTAAQSVSSGGVKDYEITFDRAYSAPPVVIPVLVGELSGSGAGHLSAVVRSVSEAGCVVRVASGNTTFSVAVAWAAFGALA